MAPSAADNTAVSEGDEPAGTDLAEPVVEAPVRPAPSPHPSTLGWEDEDGTAVGTGQLEGLPPVREAPGADRWEVVPEPEGSADWDTPAPSSASGGPRASVWTELEDERRLLPPGRTLVGRTAAVRLVGIHSPPLQARLDTGRARSVLHGEVLGEAGDTVRTRVGGAVVVLPRASSEWLSVAVTLRLEDKELPAVLRMAEPTDTEPLVLGCDLLAGHFVVDPGCP